ncbi:small ribosomal subunit protein uS9m [Chironomus tepperi]|uniref:small ribosomal subunit protein uS9m n=1 Tax=Chironomus tepperi TaxID=113505 RepID=UPI00391F4FB8
MLLRNSLKLLNNPVNRLLINRINSLNYGTVTSTVDLDFLKRDKTSKAMKAYLERAQQHDEFMKTQKEEFKIGKRHLANMMGEDPVVYEDQEKIDEAISYLMPSALYDKRARPMMKPPEKIFPERKAAEFDETGRPHHVLFYTSKPNFFQLLYDAVEHLNNLNKFEDNMTRQQKSVDPALKLELSGSEWINQDQLELKLVENIQPVEYRYFVNVMNRLVEHPYSFRVKDFIDMYRRPLMNQTIILDIPKPHIDKDGRSFITVYECLRKKARGDVTIKFPGTGKILINGQDVTYFEYDQSREQILFPLIFTEMLDKVDVEANVEGGGPSGQAGAIRWGIAMGLRSFVDPEVVEKMRYAGLLQRDYRRRERKKPGQEGARRKFTWKKR